MKNILIYRSGEVKITDFGLSIKYDYGMKIVEQVVTRWYRAPEVILRKPHNFALDIWSVGCIFAELIKERPLFPGSDEVSQLNLIFDVIGTPEPYDWPSKAWYSLQMFAPRRPRNPRMVLPFVNPKCRDLLSHLLCFNPDNRWTASQALCHSYFLEDYPERS